MLKIGLITYPIETNPAGIGVAVKHFTKHLLDIDRRNSYYLLHFTPSSDPLYRNREILYKHYTSLPVMFSDSWYFRNTPHRFDIVHRFSPGGFLFYVKALKVITVYDLFLYKPYPFNRKFHLSIHLGRIFNRRALIKADAVLAGSHFTKQEILKNIPLDANKVHVVYSAPAIDSPPTDPIQSRNILLSEYGISEDYILFVSTLEPRKNLLRLVKAYEILKAHHHRKEWLVIVGKKGWGYQEAEDYIQKSPFRHCIKSVGFVPTHHLSHFYSNASLFVYPSLMEGFGIPPLEAMKCGCPTLTSNTSSLPEVVQHPEMMFNPKDINQITEKIIRILCEPALREDNIRKGMKNAKRFSWRESAQQIISIYQTLGATRSSSSF